MTPKLSVVIRAKNEEAHLGEVLSRLESQTLQDFEVILVDNESSDRTVEIFNSSRLKHKRIVNIPREEFNYPKACNLGVSNAKAPLVLFLSGHSIPTSLEMIETIVAHFEAQKVAGVYGPCFANSNAGWFEGRFYGANNYRLKTKKIRSNGMGVLGFTNAAIRKKLWEGYPFNEINFADGGEDTQWAGHFMKRGYDIIYEPKLGVKHSHGLGVLKFAKQFVIWLYLWLKASIYNLGE